jgi:hypothetical protein
MTFTGPTSASKHNMRLRRHGDPTKVHRPGRKDEDGPLRQMLCNISDRSYGRYKRGLRLLRDFGLDAEPVIKKCTRPNGSMNWAQFEEIAESEAALALARVRDA